MAELVRDGSCLTWACAMACRSASASQTGGSGSQGRHEGSPKANRECHAGAWTQVARAVQERLEASPCLAGDVAVEGALWYRTSLGDLPSAVNGVELAKTEGNAQGRRTIALVLEVLNEGLGAWKSVKSRWRKPLLRAARVQGSQGWGKGHVPQETCASRSAEALQADVEMGDGTESEGGQGHGGEKTGGEGALGAAEDLKGSPEKVVPTSTSTETVVKSSHEGGDVADHPVNKGKPRDRTIVIAAWPYDAKEEDELTFEHGDRFAVLDKGQDSGWVYVERVGVGSAGCKGLIPSTHLEAVEVAWDWCALADDELTVKAGDRLVILGLGEDEVLLRASATGRRG